MSDKSVFMQTYCNALFIIACLVGVAIDGRRAMPIDGRRATSTLHTTTATHHTQRTRTEAMTEAYGMAWCPL